MSAGEGVEEVIGCEDSAVQGGRSDARLEAL